jgi:hypothetical protein
MKTAAIGPLVVLVLIRQSNAREYIHPSVELWGNTHTAEFPSGIFPPGNPSDIQRLALGKVLGAQGNSTVYEIADSEWVVKYTRYCTSDDYAEFADPIEREAILLERVNELAPTIANKYLYHSNSIEVPYDGGKLDKLFPIACADHSPVRVRYIVSERVGLSLYGVLRRMKKIPFSSVSRIALESFNLIRELHSATNIAHGDIHIGNIALADRSDDSLSSRLVLIDFDLAVMGSRSVTPNARERDARITARVNCHGYISPWESRNESPASFRDDMFRLVQVMAILMHGIGYSQDMRKLCGKTYDAENVQRYLEMKEKMNLFDTQMGKVYSLESVIGIPVSTIPAIRELLATLLALVRSPLTPADTPAYAAIERVLVELVELA